MNANTLQNQTPALQAQEVSVQIGARTILHSVDCSIASSQLTAIIGPNGAGKSTLVRCLGGLQTHSGKVSLEGQDLQSISARERARRISWLAQSDGGGTLDDLLVQDIVMLGRLPHQGLLASNGAADVTAVQDALAATNSAHLQDRLFGQLSGGERQKILLARALAVQASVLLMDEPLNHLDPPHQSDWLALARGLTQAGRSVVAVLHDVNFALRADDLIIIADGRLAHQGSTQDAATHRAIEAVFEQRLRIIACEGRWLSLPQ